LTATGACKEDSSRLLQKKQQKVADSLKEIENYSSKQVVHEERIPEPSYISKLPNLTTGFLLDQREKLKAMVGKPLMRPKDSNIDSIFLTKRSFRDIPVLEAVETSSAHTSKILKTLNLLPSIAPELKQSHIDLPKISARLPNGNISHSKLSSIEKDDLNNLKLFKDQLKPISPETLRKFIISNNFNYAMIIHELFGVYLQAQLLVSCKVTKTKIETTDNNTYVFGLKTAGNGNSSDIGECYITATNKKEGKLILGYHVLCCLLDFDVDILKENIK